ncbi:HlyD family secretion protein (plasmid) [Roseobacteraceae bacterium NS-SX3]
MATTSEMITSLDTPLDLVPMGETSEEETAGRAKEKPRLLRILWNVLAYALAAALLAGFLGGHAWRRLTQIELEHARFTAALSRYEAPGTGYLKRIHVAEGDQVQAGDVLARIEDPDRESDVEAARAEVISAERRLKRAKVRRDQHLALRPARRAELWAAFQQEWLPWRARDPRALRYPPRLQAAFDRLYAFDRGRDLAAGGYFAMLAALDAAVEESEQDLRRWKRQLRHRKSAANGLVVRARAPGTVYAVHAVPGGHLARNSLILEVEADTPRTAAGWLDDRMAGQVHIGMPATIRFSYRGARRQLAGTVAGIEAGADAARPDRYGMVVTVKADDAGLKNARKWFRHNAPAVIALDRSRALLFWERAADAGS